MPSSTTLPPKENSLFKRIIKCHEYKLYRTGLKFAKQILSNPQFAEHGETLAMKGLILNCLGRKEEAYEHVRRGLRNNLKSHICWHVYGLLQRSDKKYDEAIKCYRNALKWEKDHIQILRDLSNLQIQMRDLEGYRDTRYQLFMLRPTQLVSWMGFAMAYHLLKDYEMTLKVLETLRKTLVNSIQDYERSEILLYQNMVIQESGNLQGALDHLLDCQQEICDTLAVEETFAKLYIKLGKNEEAEKKIRKLLDRNPENVLYYEMLQEALDLKNDLEKLNLLRQLGDTYPGAHARKRLILNFAHAEDFKIEVEKYLHRGLRKGVPSLFVDLRSLYKDSEKVNIVESLLLSYVASLKKNGTFSLDDNGGPTEPPSVLLWIYYFLAQHYDSLGSTSQSLVYINAAIDHTPTLIELFVAKGRIYKHAGDVIEAFKWIDEAQGLDTADRYINSKCAKYMLRADLIKEAEETCSKFTREGVSAMENLNEMQCMWFQTECAFAYKRLGNWGEALKKCHEVDRHFTDIVEDQFDFHTYCMKKMTFRSYIELLRLEDVLRSHRFYKRAAGCAISVYITLHDKPISDQKTEEQQDIENLTPSELKKLRNKQRKARKKAELIANAEKKEAQNKPRQANDPDSDGPPLDELVPEKLAKVADPLEQAIKFLAPLQKLCGNSVDTHLMAYEIYSRKKKPLLMLQSVKRAHDVAGPEHSLVHAIIVQMALEMEVWESQKSLSKPVSLVIKKQMEPILKGRSPAEINQEFLKNHSDLASRHQGARMLCKIDPGKKAEALQMLTSLDDSVKGVSIADCVSVMESLANGDFGPCENVQDEFKAFCRSRFPYATAFQIRNPPKSSPLASKKHEVEPLESSCENCLSD